MLKSLVFVAFVVAVLYMADTNAGEELPLKVTTKRDNDEVALKLEQDQAILSVRSPFGISQAVIERTDDKWSHGVVLRLHLQGLEHLKVSNGTVTLKAAVSNQNGKVRLWKDGQEDEPLDAKSPYWMEIRMADHAGKATKGIPLKHGYFEMRLPKALFEGDPKSIKVNWIDFYR